MEPIVPIPPPLSYYRWPRQGPTWLSMRQMVAPGIEAGIRITIACVRCRISLLSPFNSLGGSERIRPRTLVLLCFSVLWHLLSFLFIDLFLFLFLYLFLSLSFLGRKFIRKHDKVFYVSRILQVLPQCLRSSLQTWVIPRTLQSFAWLASCFFFFPVESLRSGFQGCPLLLLPYSVSTWSRALTWASVMSCKIGLGGSCRSFLMQLLPHNHRLHPGPLSRFLYHWAICLH